MTLKEEDVSKARILVLTVYATTLDTFEFLGQSLAPRREVSRMRHDCNHMSGTLKRSLCSQKGGN